MSKHVVACGSGPNTLTLEPRDLWNLSATSNTLTVTGDADDTFNADLSSATPAFTDNGSVSGVTEYGNGVLTIFVDDALGGTINL